MYFKQIRNVFFDLYKVKTVKITGSCGDHDSHRRHQFCGGSNWGFIVHWNHPQRGKLYSHFCENESQWEVILNNHTII